MPPSCLKYTWQPPITLMDPYEWRKRTDLETIHDAVEWERYKSKIADLYVNERNTLERVQELMAEGNFLASTAQYRHQFKKWGPKKYRTLLEAQHDELLDFEEMFKESVVLSSTGEEASSQNLDENDIWGFDAELSRTLTDLFPQTVMTAFSRNDQHSPSLTQPVTKESEVSPQRRLLNASKAAWEKLKSSADSCSWYFNDFVSKCKGHNELLGRGFQTLSLIYDHQTPSTLLDVYSLLHLGYAISQTEATCPGRSTPVEFRAGIGAFRELLNDNGRYPGCKSDRELFDEIVGVMWEELEYAVSWIGKNISWNFDFMSHMSEKAREFQVAHDWLQSQGDALDITATFDPGIAYDPGVAPKPPDIAPDACPEPAFVRETRQWREEARQDILEMNDEQLRQLETPLQRRCHPDKPGWWDIVTGSIFVGILLGMLQILQTSKEPFAYLMSEGPYASLSYPDDTADKDFLMEHREQLARDLFAPCIRYHFINQENGVSLVPMHLLGAGLYLVEKGVIRTVRHFEQYLLGLRKIYRRSFFQDFDLINIILLKCWSCSEELRQVVPGKITPIRDREYSLAYINSKIDEETDFSLLFEAEYHNLNVRAAEAAFDNTHPATTLHEENEGDAEARHQPTPSSATEQALDRVFDTPAAASGTELTPHSANPSSVSRSITQQCDPTSPKQSAFTCTVRGCNDKLFTSRSNLNRHMKNYHSPASYPCGISDCQAAFANQDNLRRHWEARHHFVAPRRAKRRKTKAQ